ncbi:MAG: YihY/virulence factor BrkB family protein [Bryobacterales bacterium]
MPKPKEIWKALVRAVDAFVEDDCVTFAAALAYYAVFSLPPLLFLIAILAGGLIGWDAIEIRIFESIQSTIGPAVAEQLREALHSYGPRLRPDSLMIVGSSAVLLFAATGVLVQLQNALNRAWAVQPDPKRGYVHNMIARRLLSLGMIVVLTVVMLGSVLIGTVVAIAGEGMSYYLPEGFSEPVLQALDLGAGFAIFFVAVAAVFGIMPDAKVELRDIWIGSANHGWASDDRQIRR